MNLDEYMCPNCVTPWKCNGPHILDESMSRRQQDEQVEYQYAIYNDIWALVQRDGIGAVMYDLEHLYPKLYEQITSECVRRYTLKTRGALLTKNAT